MGLGLLTLLTTTQLLDTLLLVVLAVERDTDTDTSVIFDTLTWLFVRVFIVSVALIGLALDEFCERHWTFIFLAPSLYSSSVMGWSFNAISVKGRVFNRRCLHHQLW